MDYSYGESSLHYTSSIDQALPKRNVAKVPLNEIDIKSLIKLSWNQLGILLTGLTPIESNQVIEVLLKELETWQSNMIEKHEKTCKWVHQEHSDIFNIL